MGSDYSVHADLGTHKDDLIAVLDLPEYITRILAERKYTTVGDVATTLDTCPAALIAVSGAHTVACVAYTLGRYCCACGNGHKFTPGTTDAPAFGHSSGKGWATTPAPTKPYAGIDGPPNVATNPPAADIASQPSTDWPFADRIVHSVSDMVELLGEINRQVLDAIPDRTDTLRLIAALNLIAPDSYIFGPKPDGTYGYRKWRS